MTEEVGGVALPLAADQMIVGTGWRYSKGGLHAAIDYKVPIGTTVFAVGAGTILACHDGVTNKSVHVTGAPSNWVLLGIKHAGMPASVLYQHLSPGIAVSAGQKIKGGDTLGESGSSGNAFGAHLHVAAMVGHRDKGTRYDYLHSIGAKEGPPTDGTASNEICIFPPSLVYDAAMPAMAAADRFASGVVFVDKLHFGTMDSDSVRRLQHRLNHIPLKDGKRLRITGNYGLETKAEATKWQLQKDGREPGTLAADGNIGPKQAIKLFGKRYTVKAHA
jgi:murein DD-endopeptidase MepM/ murein hydrolase activator NlpD